MEPSAWVDSLAAVVPRLVGLVALGSLLIRSVVERVELEAASLLLVPLARALSATNPQEAVVEPESNPTTLPVTEGRVELRLLGAPISRSQPVVSPVVRHLKPVNPHKKVTLPLVVAVELPRLVRRHRMELLALATVLVAVAVLLPLTDRCRVLAARVAPATSGWSG